MRMRNCVLCVVLLALTGCTSMAPDYTRPQAPVSDSWPGGPAYGEIESGPAGRQVADVPWREFFADDNLQQVIALALQNNRDLRQTALNVQKVRARYRIRRAELFPQLDAGGSYSKRRIPDVSGFGEALTLEEYDANLGVSSWEIDFFGRVRSLEDQALEEFFATEEARRSARIALVGDVARTYLTLGADRERLAVAEQTLKSRRDTYRLTRKRFDVGVASALDLRQAQTSVESTRVDIGRYTTLVAQDENALRLLVGSDVPAGLLPAGAPDAVAAVKPLPAGLPSTVLQRRPDILAAEHRLQGANADIGAARAALFPRISLTAAAGFASSQLGALFSSDARAWSFSPRVDLPIFTAGRLRAELQVSKVDREIALAAYENAIQAAFREVADALAERGTLDEQLSAQQALADAAAEAYHLSDARFRKGIDSFLNVLDSQRSFYGARQGLITLQLASLANDVTLYQVLGGGAAPNEKPGLPPTAEPDRKE